MPKPAKDPEAESRMTTNQHVMIRKRRGNLRKNEHGKGKSEKLDKGKELRDMAFRDGSTQGMEVEALVRLYPTNMGITMVQTAGEGTTTTCK